MAVRRFDAVEHAQTLQKAEQIVRAVEADLNQLAISTRDHAQWDQMYRYIRRPNHSERVVDTPHGPMAFSLVEINRADRSAPTGAPLLFARFFDSAEILRVAQISNLPSYDVDLNRFKHINDMRCHGIGDQLLKILAQRAR